MSKEYVCSCGRKFTSSQQINAHKSKCKVHLLATKGNLDNYYKMLRGQSSTLKQLALKRRTIKNVAVAITNIITLRRFISENRKCKTCGKVMKKFTVLVDIVQLSVVIRENTLKNQN